MSTLHRWFDHYLLGVRNGVEREPGADVERSPDHWTTDRSWPPAGTGPARLGLRPGTTPGLGTLGPVPAAPGSTAAFTDAPQEWEEDWAAGADTPSASRAVFTTGTLTRDLRLSGSGTVTLTASSSTTSAHLSAVLVDLGPDTVRDFLGAKEGIADLATRSCWGESTAGDSACFRDTAADTADVAHTVVSRGWADLGHTTSAWHGRPLVPGRAYTATVTLGATDHVVPAGHRLALIVAGTDAGLVEPPGTTPTVTLDLARSHALLPLVGGARGLAATTPHASVAQRAADVPAAPPRTARTVPAGR